MISVKTLRKNSAKTSGIISPARPSASAAPAIDHTELVLSWIRSWLVPVDADGTELDRTSAAPIHALKAKFPLYSVGEISAFGFQEGEGAPSVGIDEEALAEYLKPYAKKTDIPAAPDLSPYAKKTDIPSLSGYATEQWVLDKKYLTAHQDLSAYLKSADAASTYLKKTDAASTYLAKNDAATLYQPKGSYALASDLTTHTGNDDIHFTAAERTKLAGIAAGANAYTHPTATASTIAAASGKVLSSITVNSLGHVTAVGSKTLAEADIPALAISKITGLQTALDAKLAAATFSDLFEKVNVGTSAAPRWVIKAKYGLYSVDEISAFGFQEGSAAGSGGVGINASELGQYLTDNGYATQAWVLGKKYLTAHQSLADYLKSADAASTYLKKADATSTYLSKADATAIYQPKGNYLTAHQTLYTLTVQKNGTQVGTFKPNANATINITDVASASTLSTHTSDTAIHITAAERTAWNGKVDAVSGKGLSSNDFTDALLTKLNGIAAGANAYTHPTATASTIAAASGKVLSSITVNSLGHVTAVGSKTLAEADIPALAISKITGLQTALDAKVAKAGDTMTGDLSFAQISGTAYPINSVGLKWTGGTDGANIFYRLTGSDAGKLILNMTDDSNTEINFEWSGASYGTTKTPYRFQHNALLASEVAATFKSVKIGDCEITWDATNGALKFSKNIYSASEVAAFGYGSGSAASGGVGINETDLAAYLTSNKYATQAWVEAKNYLTAHQDLSKYMKFSREVVDPNTINGIIGVREVNSSTNAPTTNGWHQYMSWGSGDSGYGFEFAHKYSAESDVFYRQKIGSTKGWTAWKTLLSSANTKIENGVITINGSSITPLVQHQSLANYVTLNTQQTITGKKTFSEVIAATSKWILAKVITGETNNACTTTQYAKSHSIELGYPNRDYMNFNEFGGVFNFYKTNTVYTAESGNGTLVAKIDGTGITAASFIKSGGTASQSLMADGSVRSINIPTARGHLGWTDTKGHLTTIDTIAFWDGRYNAATSNLAYCNQGAFGDMATKNASDYLARSGGSMANTNVVTNLNADLLDGWHANGLTGKAIKKSGCITSSTAGLSSYWGKLATINVTEYENKDITLYLHSTYGNLYGILNIGIRINSGSESYTMRMLMGNIPADNIRLYRASSSPRVFELWVNVSNQWGCLNAVVISETNRYGQEAGDWVTMHNTNFSTVQTSSLPSYINPAYSSLTNNVATATKLQTTRTLWGQSFDGSGNVSGNMTGVGNLVFSNGGGFYMSDATWIRTYGDKSFYHNTGTFRTDGKFEVGGNGERFVVLSNGNVGIGTTAPTEKLNVSGNIRATGAVNGLDLGATGAVYSRFHFFKDYANNQTTGFYIDSSTGGSLYIGLWKDDFVGNGTVALFEQSKAANFYGAMAVTGGLEAKSSMTVKGTASIYGGVKLGNADNNSSLEIFHSTPFIDFHFGRSTDDYTSRIIEHEKGSLRVVGNLSATGEIAALSASDFRLKTNVRPLREAVRRLRALGGYSVYDYLPEAKARDPHARIGLIAQNVQGNVGSLMRRQRDDGFLSLNYLHPDYINLIGAATLETADELTKAKRRIKQLEARVAQLEAG